MGTVMTAPTFREVNLNAQPYPAHLLPEGGSALALFSAGFHGWNDVIHMARKDMQVVCVDVDAERLLDMSEIYPHEYEWHVEDAWDFAMDAAERELTWDVVSVDPYMGDAAERVWHSMWLWSSLATRLLTITVDPSLPLWGPPGWLVSLYPRSARASWMVLRRA